METKNGRIRVFKVLIGEKSRIHLDPDPKHWFNAQYLYLICTVVYYIINLEYTYCRKTRRFNHELIPPPDPCIAFLKVINN